jgi:hypothetical protein
MSFLVGKFTNGPELVDNSLAQHILRPQIYHSLTRHREETHEQSQTVEHTTLSQKYPKTWALKRLSFSTQEPPTAWKLQLTPLRGRMCLLRLGGIMSGWRAGFGRFKTAPWLHIVSMKLRLVRRRVGVERGWRHTCSGLNVCNASGRSVIIRNQQRHQHPKPLLSIASCWFTSSESIIRVHSRLAKVNRIYPEAPCHRKQDRLPTNYHPFLSIRFALPWHQFG